MAQAHRRKKQPQIVRQAILDATARIAVAEGLAAVSLQSVAAAAGITKGGLFHHFASKQEMIVSFFCNLLEQFDAEIDQKMAADPERRGRFTRAYIDSMFAGHTFGRDDHWNALWHSIIADSGLRDLWMDWMRKRLATHQETDSGPMLEMIRLAADGMWIYTISGASIGSDVRDFHQRLLAYSRFPNA